ncbi:MAG TPA: hypothetical protein VFW39_12915 [Sphingomicrobium sp.]|nr:hypothetical protein [Sphingomicrobium sp.]
MTVREFVSVFISIIIGLAVADLLISFHRLIRVDARVKWYWLVPALAFYMLLVIVNFWWGTYWSFAGLRSLSMGAFIPTLLSAIALFLLAAAVLPDETVQDGLDLKAWYVRNAGHIWVLAFIGLSLVMLVEFRGEIAGIVARGHSSPMQIARAYLGQEWDNLLSLIAYAALIFTKRLRIHEAVVVLSLLDMAYTATWLAIF